MNPQNFRRRLLVNDGPKLSLSSLTNSVSAASGSITVSVMYNDVLLKADGVTVTKNGDAISSATYNKSTGKITINYNKNLDLVNNRFGYVLVTYNSSTVTYTLQQNKGVLYFSGSNYSSEACSSYVTYYLTITNESPSSNNKYTGGGITVSSNQSWISTSYDSSSGGVSASWGSWTDKDYSRSGTVTVTYSGTGPSNSWTFDIYQSYDRVKRVETISRSGSNYSITDISMTPTNEWKYANGKIFRVYSTTSLNTGEYLCASASLSYSYTYTLTEVQRDWYYSGNYGDEYTTTSNKTSINDVYKPYSSSMYSNLGSELVLHSVYQPDQNLPQSEQHKYLVLGIGNGPYDSNSWITYSIFDDTDDYKLVIAPTSGISTKLAITHEGKQP